MVSRRTGGRRLDAGASTSGCFTTSVHLLEIEVVLKPAAEVPAVGDVLGEQVETRSGSPARTWACAVSVIRRQLCADLVDA